jgi:glyoxylase-like metal-dependent hydrolase (beta-lactamase superfamily II)
LKIIQIKGRNDVYSSNVYMILGDWKRIEDKTTLIDVGSDPSIIDVINSMNTGLGKNKIDQVILTHNHSDHVSILPQIIKEFHPEVFSFSPFLDGLTRVLSDGEMIHIGDKYFEVIHTPGHSSDSISLYNEENKVLFVGDTPIIIHSQSGGYEEDFIAAIVRLSQKEVRAIYFGHGDPIFNNSQSLLIDTLRNIRVSMKKEKHTIQ